MDGKRALILSLSSYAASYAATYAGAVFLGANFLSGRGTTIMFMYTILTSTLITLVFTAWYFFKGESKPNLTHGLYLGFTMMFFHVVGEFLLTIMPNILGGSPQRATMYFANPLFIAELAIIVIVAGVCGEYLGKVHAPLKKK